MSRMYLKMGSDRQCKSCGGKVFVPIVEGYENYYDYCPYCGEEFEEVDA